MKVCFEAGMMRIDGNHLFPPLHLLLLFKENKKVICLCSAAVVLSLNKKKKNLGSVQNPLTLICSFRNEMSSSLHLICNASACFPFFEVCLCSPNCGASIELLAKDHLQISSPPFPLSLPQVSSILLLLCLFLGLQPLMSH